MKSTTPILRLLPPQRVAESEQIAPLQYSLKDTARLLSMSTDTVRRLIKRGELESIGRGKLLRVPYDSMLTYINRHRNDEAA